MSRGFGGFEVDDFRDSDRGSGCGPGRGSSSSVSPRVALHLIHREEDQSDQPSRQNRDRSALDRAPLAREARVQEILSQPTRTKYTDRDRTYSLRDSDIHTLSEVGKFRVVATNDLAELAYNGDRSRMESDVESLERQRLVRVISFSDAAHHPVSVVSLTKQGHKLLSRGMIVPSGQNIYHGLKKPREALHDAELYRVYHKASDQIEGRGGRVLRVVLDYEMKHELYQSLARASEDKTMRPAAIKEQVAEQYNLKVVDEQIPIPDLRIEYDEDGEIQRRDLELATDHYRPQGLSQKARAGFQIYARPGETNRLRRIRDDRELSAAIFSL